MPRRRRFIMAIAVTIIDAICHYLMMLTVTR